MDKDLITKIYVCMKNKDKISKMRIDKVLLTF